MKTMYIYQCEVCKKQYDSREDAIMCEANCLGLTSEEYSEYLKLLSIEKQAFGRASVAMNDNIRKECDLAVHDVLAFKFKHNLKDNTMYSFE